MPLYDEEGNEVEGALAPHEAKELLDKAQKVETLEAEIQKFQSKDFNFSKFREKTKEEQDKIKSEMSQKEKMLLDEIEDLRGKIGAKDEATIGEARKMYLKSYAGEDEKLQELIEAEYNKLPTEALTPEQVAHKMGEANALVQYRLSQMNEDNRTSPFNFVPSSTAQFQFREQKKKSFADTPEGEGLAGDLGLTTKPRQ